MAKSAFITSGVIAFFFFAFFGLLGMYGKALGITNEQFVALEVIQQKMTGMKYALTVAAFFAAVMSTADTFLGVTALAFAKGTIYRSHLSLESSSDDAIFIRKLRRITLFTGALSLGFAYLVRDIVDAFAMAFGLLMVFLPAFIGGLLSEHPRERDAKWSSILGLIAVVVGAIAFGFKTAFVPGFVVAMSSYVILSRFRGKWRAAAGAK